MSFVDSVEKADRFWRKLGRVFAIFGGLAMIFLTFLVVVDVTLRYVFNKPIPGATEGTELILPYIVFLALSYTLAKGGHVRVSILLMRLDRGPRMVVELIDCIIGMAFFGALTYYAWIHFWESFRILEFMMAPVKLPWWVGKFSMPLGFFAIFVQFLLLALRVQKTTVERDE